MKKIFQYLCLIFLINSCGGPSVDEAPKPPTAQQEPESEIKQSTEILFDVRAVGDLMTNIAFEPNEFSVPANSNIRVRLVNEGTMEGMNHNIVFVVMGSGEEIAKAGIEAGPNARYIPDNPNVLAASELVEPGKITEFTFASPPVGSYHYICTFPGHFPQMIGRLNVTGNQP
jgi:azurin